MLSALGRESDGLRIETMQRVVEIDRGLSRGGGEARQVPVGRRGAEPSRKCAAADAASFLLAFGCAIAINLLRGRRIECGCFGVVAEERLTWLSVARNMLFCFAAALVFWYPVSALASPWGVSGDASLQPRVALALLVAATAVLPVCGLAQELGRIRRVTKLLGREAR